VEKIRSVTQLPIVHPSAVIVSTIVQSWPNQLNRGELIVASFDAI